MSDDDLIRREAEELIAFLRGAAPLHGCWFGERYDDRPAFWWRNELGRLERAIPATDARPALLYHAMPVKPLELPPMIGMATDAREAAAVVLDAMNDGEVWGRAVNAAMPIINADLDQSAWVTVSEVREALIAALRALIGEERT